MLMNERFGWLTMSIKPLVSAASDVLQTLEGLTLIPVVMLHIGFVLHKCSFFPPSPSTHS